MTQESSSTSGRASPGTDPQRRRPRMLYLGFAFPPGVQHLHPGTNPAGHKLETLMVRGLESYFEVRSVGLLPFAVMPDPAGAERSPGLDHALVLVEKPPHVWHRWRALRQLRSAYAAWRCDGWVPDVLVAYNFCPVYNAFLRSLAAPVPARVLLLADSTGLGRTLPSLKALRHRLKPFTYEDGDMLPFFDACVGLSRDTGRFFSPQQVPWLWMPGGCAPERAVKPSPPGEGPVRFGYFGSLAPHSGINELIEAFRALPGETTLSLCGYGKQSDAIAARCRDHPRLRFAGLLPAPEDCLQFAQGCDVLVNPRPLLSGNENNFPSKIFDYGLCGRAILTTGFAGVREVLGPEGFYLDERDLAASLGRELAALSAWSRAELARRGSVLQARILAGYSWAEQARRIARFIAETCGSRSTRVVFDSIMSA